MTPEADERQDDSRSRSRWLSDAIAGITTGIANIPDAMANGVLAGVTPLQGLYAVLVGLPTGALLTSSVFMTVATTGAMSLAVADGLAAVPAGSRLEALVVISLLVGGIQIALGLLKAGTLVRFVSNSVMRGFLTGVAINIILSQIAPFTGYDSAAQNKVVRAVDTALHPLQLDWRTIAIGLLTLAIVVWLMRTRVGSFSLLIALVAATAAVQALGWSDVALVRDISEIPLGLPEIQIPTLRLVIGMVPAAIAVSLIGLIQAAGVSKSVPNPDGHYPDVSRDFVGQGAANVAASLVGGLPVGGSVSSTALSVSSGARSRWANVFAGGVILLVLLVLAPVVQLVPLTSMAALLFVAAYSSIRFGAIEEIWNTSMPVRVVMVFTFVATLVAPVQFAVLMGAALSVMQYIYSASLDVRVVELVERDGGFVEQDPPARLPDHQVTVLDIYGSVFFAGSDLLAKLLPDAGGSRRAAVVLRLRGRTFVGSTEIALISRYRDDIEAGGGRLFLAGVSPELMDQLRRTGVLGTIPPGAIFPATERVYDSVRRAKRAAEGWVGRDT